MLALLRRTRPQSQKDSSHSLEPRPLSRRGLRAPSNRRCPHPRRHEVAFAIRGPIARADLPGPCLHRVRAVLGESGSEARCDVAGWSPTRCASTHWLAPARRAAARVLRAARERLPALLELVDLMGLTHVLPADE